MKNVLIKIMTLYPIRFIVLLFIKLLNWLEMLLSQLKLKATIVNSQNSSKVHWSTEIKYGANISIGHQSRVGKYCTLGAKEKIVIGNNVVVSKLVSIETSNLDFKNDPSLKTHTAKPIHIMDNVWIGTHSVVLGGVTIGKNSVIAAGSIVSKSIPPDCIYIRGEIKKNEKAT